MVRRNTSGRHIAARCVLGAVLLVSAAPSAAQIPGAVQAGAPIPDRLELSRIVWSTMNSIDDANRSGNYSVLRDLGAPGFQQNNDAAKLTQVFAGLRSQNIDLSTTLLLAPTFSAAPAIVGPGLMRLTGQFGLRPTAINFDLIFQYVGARWRLYGVSIVPVSLASVQPTAAAPPHKKP